MNIFNVILLDIIIFKGILNMSLKVFKKKFKTIKKKPH